MKYDFCGWATRNDLKCSDGRTIRRDAFKDNDGQTVPLVWNHQHTDPTNVLGHAMLENREDGVYMYGTFNDTPKAEHTKHSIINGDIVGLSIWANNLVQKGSDVMHGAIREVSLVLAGANPGAHIESVLVHGELSDEEAIIYSGMPIELAHADDDDEKSEESKTKTEDKKMPDAKTDSKEKTVGDVLDELTEEQRTVVMALIGQAIEDTEAKYGKGKSNDKGEEEMKHNVFDGTVENNDQQLMHDAMDTIIRDGKKFGSLKESFIAHAEEYGIENIDYLLPEAKTLNTTPEFIKRKDDWVSVVMNGVHRTPFSRIKSIFADITEDEARAKGYIKGKLKKEEVFSLLKRTTTPTTIYKKQKIDRDDVVDITDFDAVAWIKTEMRMMLDEEIARAILVGDGRLASDDDHINETNIRPIISDADLYTIKKVVTPEENESEAHALITAAVKARKEYRGSGNPILLVEEDILADMLLMEDSIGHRLYKTEQELATALRVSRIVEVPIMPSTHYGVIVNLNDYNLGADKGGAINMFEDFDIDYNQMKYLMETRASGAMIKPYAAISLLKASN